MVLGKMLSLCFIWNEVHYKDSSLDTIQMIYEIMVLLVYIIPIKYIFTACIVAVIHWKIKKCDSMHEITADIEDNSKDKPTKMLLKVLIYEAFGSMVYESIYGQDIIYHEGYQN